MSKTDYQEIEIPSSYAKAREAEQEIVRTAEGLGYNEEDLFALQLSLEEALSNAIRHGNGQDAGKKVTIRYYISPEQIDVYVADEGAGFDPMRIPDPTTEANLHSPNGRGIMLMRAYMNLVEFSEPGNVVHLMKLNPHVPGTGQRGV